MNIEFDSCARQRELEKEAKALRKKHDRIAANIRQIDEAFDGFDVDQEIIRRLTRNMFPSLRNDPSQ